MRVDFVGGLWRISECCHTLFCLSVDFGAALRTSLAGNHPDSLAAREAGRTPTPGYLAKVREGMEALGSRNSLALFVLVSRVGSLVQVGGHPTRARP